MRRGQYNMNEKETKDIGYRIYSLRKDKGYTREQLAELAGISSKFIYEIEVKGTGFSSNTLERLADALEVSCDYILKGKNNSKMEGKIAETIERFEPSTLRQVEALLKIAYELSHFV